jgi:hypothetical protein
MSDLVLTYMTSLAFIAYGIWIYTTHYRIIKKDINEQKLEEIESKLNKVLAVVAIQRR